MRSAYRIPPVIWNDEVILWDQKNQRFNNLDKLNEKLTELIGRINGFINDLSGEWDEKVKLFKKTGDQNYIDKEPEVSIKEQLPKTISEATERYTNIFPSTIDTRKGILKWLKKYKKKTGHDDNIASFDLRQFYNFMTGNLSTKTCFLYAGLIATTSKYYNVRTFETKWMEKPDQKLIEALTRDEVKTIFDFLESYDKNTWKLLNIQFYGALRASDIPTVINMYRRDLDEISFKTTKTGRTKVYPLDPIHHLWGESGTLEPVWESYDSFYYKLRKAMETEELKAKLNRITSSGEEVWKLAYRSHTWRKTMASFLFDDAKDMSDFKFISETVLAHKSLSTSEIYWKSKKGSALKGFKL